MTIELFEILEKVRESPELYLDKVSFAALSDFIHNHSRKEFELGKRDRSVFSFHNFRKFVENLYNFEESENYFSLIPEIEKDDEKAFHLFFKLFDDYLKSRTILISENCLNFLSTIKDSPETYLGEASLNALRHFITGYSAREELLYGDLAAGINLCKFQSYIESLHNFSEESKNCFTLIEKIAKCDKEAFHLFFKLLDDFLANQKGAIQ